MSTAGPPTRLTVAASTNLVDAMISDVSGIVTDFMQSLKPYAMTVMIGTPDEFAVEFPTSLGGYLVDRDLSDLGSVVDLMLGTDPHAALRRERPGVLPRPVLRRGVGSSVRRLRRPVGGSAPRPDCYHGRLPGTHTCSDGNIVSLATQLLSDAAQPTSYASPWEHRDQHCHP